MFFLQLKKTANEGIAWLTFLLLLPFTCISQNVELAESFDNDPLTQGSFQQWVEGTESHFNHDSANKWLNAYLDVDAESAYYLSNTFESFEGEGDLSFSCVFLIQSVDDSAPPTAFIGLMTSTHIENFGDGLSLTLATNDGALVGTAAIDAGDFKFEGEEIPLQLGQWYLALGHYVDSSNSLTVSLYSGEHLQTKIGESTTQHPAGIEFLVNRLGVQNGGSRTQDQSVGALSLILDDFSIPGKAPVFISGQNSTVEEGDNGSVQMEFDFSLNQSSEVEVVVDFAIEPDTAQANQDFVSINGSITFPPGVTQQTITVPIVSDRLVEPDESLKVILSNPSNAFLTQEVFIGTILNDDILSVMSENLNVTEGQEGIQQVALPVRLSHSSLEPVSLTYQTLEGSAKAVTDYVFKRGILIFQPGETLKEIILEIVGDRMYEEDEIFLVNLKSNDFSKVVEIVIENDDSIPSLTIDDSAIIEGNQGPSNAAIGVNLKGSSYQQVEVKYRVVEKSAKRGEDFELFDGSIVFPPGEQSASILITVFGDLVPEENETFVIEFFDPLHAFLEDTEATIQIIDNDSMPQLTVSPLTILEGEIGVFNFMLSRPITQSVRLHYRLEDGSAIAPQDYLQIEGELIFAPGETNRTLPVSTLSDTIRENQEFFTLILESIQNANSEEKQFRVFIEDQIDLSYRVDSVKVLEGDFGAQLLEIPVQILQPSNFTRTLFFRTHAGSATANLDFLSSEGSISLKPGQEVASVFVSILGDLIDEPAETFDVQISETALFSSIGAEGKIEITDDDPVEIRVNNAQILEGDFGIKNMQFECLLSSPAEIDIHLDYQTIEGTALADEDYELSSGSIVFESGTLRKNISIPIIGDTLAEPDESFFLQLSNQSEGKLITPSATAWILDDDRTTSLIVPPSVFIEGDVGKKRLDVSFILEHELPDEARIGYFLEGGTATLGEDYTGGGGVLIFAPGSTIQTIQVEILGDELDELDEFFEITLLPPPHIEVVDPPVRIYIQDDDAPAVIISDAVATELDGQDAHLEFVVELTSISEEVVEVSFLTREDTATESHDFRFAEGKIIFEPGTLSQIVSIDVISDDIAESIETFRVLLLDPLNAELGRAEAIGTILDDDIPRLTIKDLFVEEGHDGFNTIIVPVELDKPTNVESSLSFTTLGITATPGLDFQLLSEDLTFNPGQRSDSISIQIVGDRIAEDHETFQIHFSNPKGIQLPINPGEITIVNDDPLPVLEIGDVTVNEGDDFVVNAVIVARLSSPSDRVVTFDYEAIGASATSGIDFLPRAGTLTFAPGIVERNIVVPVLGDIDDESNENFIVRLSNPAHLVLRETQAQITIIDDDRLPVIHVAPISLHEGSDSLLEFQLSAPSSLEIQVRYTTEDISATAPDDYIDVQGVITIPPGNHSASIMLSALEDGLKEGTENFRVLFSDTVNATLNEDSRAVSVEILDQEENGIVIEDLRVPEPDQQTGIARIRVRLSTPSTSPVTARYVTKNGTAVGGMDYVENAGELLFAPGTTLLELPVLILHDEVDEPDEYFEIQLSNAENSDLLDSLARVTILDDDPPEILVEDVTVDASAGARVEAAFLFKLTSPSQEEVTVRYFTSNASATGGTDFEETRGEVRFEPGSTELSVPVSVKGNTLDENDEVFFLNLIDPVNSIIGRARAIGRILNPVEKNQPPFIEITNPFDQQILIAPSEVNVTATTMDPDPGDSVVQVGFYLHGALVHEDLAPPFEWTWVNPPNGNHLLTVEAMDTFQARTLSEPVTFTVRPPDNTPPEIASIPDKRILVGESLAPISLNVSDAETGLSELVISAQSSHPSIVNSNQIKLEFNQGRWILLLQPEAGQAGVTTILIIVQDEQGATAETRFNLEILPLENKPPSVNITSPLPFTSIQPDILTQPPVASIHIQASAMDDGSISKVEFYANGQWVGIADNTDFDFIWNDVKEGDYLLKAKATDDQGLTAESNLVEVTVSDLSADVAIVRTAQHPEIDIIRDYLFEIGLSSRVFEADTINRHVLSSFSLVIWHDLKGKVLNSRVVSTFTELFEKDAMPLYFMGSSLSRSVQELSEGAQLEWEKLIHMNHRPELNSNGFIDFDRDTSLLSVTSNRFGYVNDFVVDELIESAVASVDADVIAYSGEVDLVTIYPSVNEFDIGQTRILAQNFGILTGDDSFGVLQQKKLFLNGICWLLRCPGCSQIGLFLVFDHLNQSHKVGSRINVPFRVINNGECDAPASFIDLDIPIGLAFLNVEHDGSVVWDYNRQTRRLTLDLGRVVRGGSSAKHIELEFLALVGGEYQMNYSLRANYSPAKGFDHFMRVQGGGGVPNLSVSAVTPNSFRLEVENPTSTYGIWYSPDLDPSTQWILFHRLEESEEWVSDPIKTDDLINQKGFYFLSPLQD